jgi:hypothetical protein
MPNLPSGRRVELSQDRLMAMLKNLKLDAAVAIYHSIQEPDDLLSLLDVIYFSPKGETPYYANFVASDWEANAQDWYEDDRAVFRTWLLSAESRTARANAMRSIKQAMDAMEFSS